MTKDTEALAAKIGEIAASIRINLYRAMPTMPNYPVGIVETVLTNALATPAATPDTIGSHFGNGGGHPYSVEQLPLLLEDHVTMVLECETEAHVVADAVHIVRLAAQALRATAPVDPAAGGEALREKVARIIADGSHGDPWWWKAAFDDGREEIAVRLREDDLALACTILAALQGPAA